MVTDSGTKVELLNEHTRGEIDHWVARFPAEHKRSAVLQALACSLALRELPLAARAARPASSQGERLGARWGPPQRKASASVPSCVLLSLSEG